MNSGRCRTRLLELAGQWDLVSVEEPIVTHASCLLPADRSGLPVMLKTSAQPDEMRGFALLQWWDGRGAARVLECGPDFVLMERATGGGSLVRMSEAGNDDRAVALICQVLARLHTAGSGPPPPLVPLSEWFESLFACDLPEPFIGRGKEIAAELLTCPERPAVLHGDMHHANVVQLANGAWLAIDPQGLLGNRAYDYANIFRNPNLEIAADPDIFRTRLAQVSATAAIDPIELLKWIAALCALSASWGDDPGPGLPAGTDRTIAELALAQLDALA